MNKYQIMKNVLPVNYPSNSGRLPFDLIGLMNPY